MSQFTDLSIKLTKDISNEEIKNGGIFFTPQSIIKKNIEIIKKIDTISIKTILEPSCGSCEYINILQNEFNNVTIVGIEKNTNIFEQIKDLYTNTTNTTKITLHNANFLEYNDTQKYDLIIGNPPYFVMKKENVNNIYKSYIDGRPNIFTLFIIHSLLKLNKNGILSFILPSSFINCLYYDKIRKHIYTHYKIIDIIHCDDDKYLDTEQKTLIFIVQNINNSDTIVNNNDTIVNNNNFVLLKNNYTIFNTKENIIKLKSLCNETENTLESLGFNVNIGNVVWNQCKDILTHDETKTRLIYNSDIVRQQLTLKKYNNEEKKNYIDKEGNTNPLLVLNRGYGKGKYVLDYCLINIEKNYLVENHLICIKHTTETDKKKLLELYNKIITSFNNPKTTEFINLYFGNAAINTTELKSILPIYV
jgi:hypothetical protein